VRKILLIPAVQVCKTSTQVRNILLPTELLRYLSIILVQL